MQISERTKSIAMCAVFVAAALVLSLVEQWIPPFIPVPGVRLGIANIAVMTAMYMLGAVSGVWVLVGKCVLAGIFAGSITSAVYSIIGGLLAYLTMLGAMKLRRLSPVGVSVLGAAAHVVGQILVSMLMMGTTVTVAYLPILLIFGAVTGTVTGLVAAWLLTALRGIGK